MDNFLDIDVEKMSEDQLRRLVSVQKRQMQIDLQECFDARNPNSRLTEKQKVILQDTLTPYRVIRAGNQSSKTSTLVRDYAWKLGENHPYWERRTGKKCPKCKETYQLELMDAAIRQYHCHSCQFQWMSWGADPLTFLCVFQTGKHIDDIWESRLSPFFSQSEVKPDIKGGILQSVAHKKNGNKILFFSHDNATEVRKRIQYFSAHDAWIDEMPGHYKVYEELMRRVDANQGQFTATLTPKVVNIDVKNFIDNLDPALHKLHRMSKLDNPIYKGREEAELAKLKSLPEADQRAILYGDWVYTQDLRLNINPHHIVPLPEHYSRTWEHVIAIDPASASKSGWIVFAKEPADLDTWYVVRGCYIKGEAPSKLVNETIPKYEAGLNIIKRVYDPHEAWFAKEAAASPEPKEYESPYNKKDRRKELLGGAEEALLNPKIKFVDGECSELVEEFNSAEEDPNKPGDIKNASKYHCIDAFIYGLDLLPKYETPPKPMTIREAFRMETLKAEAEYENPFTSTPGKFANTTTVSQKAKKLMKRHSVRWARRRI